VLLLGITAIHPHTDKHDKDMPVFMAPCGDVAERLELAMHFYNLLKGPKKDKVLIKSANHTNFKQDECIDEAAEKMDVSFKKHV
jgi:hypothetical protein